MRLLGFFAIIYAGFSAAEWISNLHLWWAGPLMFLGLSVTVISIVNALLKGTK